MRLSKIMVLSLVATNLTIVCCAANAAPDTSSVNSLIQETNKYLHENDYTKALTSCNKALELDPNNIKALHKRVVIYMLMKQPERARPDLDKLIQLSKTPAQKHAATAYKYSYFNQFKEAKMELDEAIKLDSKNLNFYADRADALAKLKQYDLALKDVDKAIAQVPKFFGAYFARARIYKAMGDEQKSKSDFATAEKLKAAAPHNDGD